MRHIFLAIIVALALASQAQALELTVEQCVAMGLSNNPALKAHEAKIESSRQDTLISRSAYMPTLTARGLYATVDEPQRIVIEKNLLGPGAPASDTEIRGEKDFYVASLTLRQTLYAGGRITHAYQRDNEYLASARHEFGNQRSQLTYDLRKTFYETLIHQAYVDSYVQQVNARQEALRVAMALAEEGLLSNDKTLQARAKLIFSEAELMQARQRADDSLDQLRRLLALDSDEELVLIDGKTYPVLKNATLDLNETALNKREDYKQLEAQLKAAEENLRVAKGGYQPEIYAEGGYLRQRETDLVQADTWGVSVNLDWPLFEGGKTDAEVGKANVEKQRLENLRRDLVATIRNEVQAGQRLVQQKQHLTEAYLINLQAEERGYQDILAQQEQGEIMAADRQEQKARLLMAQANYQESINQLRIAVAALEAATAASLEDLFGAHEIYRLDPAKLEQPPASPEPPKPSATVPTLPATQAAEPRTVPDQAPPTTMTSASLPGDNPPYAIQFGAFKVKKRARTYMKSLQKQYPGKTFETVAANSMYKVRSGQLSSREAAEAALQEFGGKGLIVRASSNH